MTPRPSPQDIAGREGFGGVGLDVYRCVHLSAVITGVLFVSLLTWCGPEMVDMPLGPDMARPACIYDPKSWPQGYSRGPFLAKCAVIAQLS